MHGLHPIGRGDDMGWRGWGEKVKDPGTMEVLGILGGFFREFFVGGFGGS